MNLQLKYSFLIWWDIHLCFGIVFHRVIIICSNMFKTKSWLAHLLAASTLLPPNCSWLFSNLLGKAMMTDGQFEKIASCESVVKTICYGALMAKMQVRGQFKWNQMHRRVGSGYSPGPGHSLLKDCLLCKRWNPLFIWAGYWSIQWIKLLHL